MKQDTKISLSLNVGKKRARILDVELSSYDKGNHEFEISFLDYELLPTDEVHILSKFNESGTTDLSPATIRDGKAYFVFDTDLINKEEDVTSYVHLKTEGMQVEVDAFKFHVDLAEIDANNKVVAEVYDGKYEKLIADFETHLQEHLAGLEMVNEELLRGEAEIHRVELKAKESALKAQQAMSDFLAMLDVDVATLGADGKLSANQIPALAINDTHVVHSKEEIVALVAERGDVAVLVHDENVSDAYILTVDEPSVLDNWIKLGVSYVAQAGHAETATIAVNSQRISGHRVVALSEEEYNLGAKDPETVYLVGEL